MKKITLNLLKGLLVIVLFTGGSVVLSTTGVQTVSEASAKVIGAPQGPAGKSAQSLTAVKVSQYLISKGYEVYSVRPIAGTGKWRAVVAGVNGIATLVIDAGVVNSGTNSLVGSADGAL